VTGAAGEKFTLNVEGSDKVVDVLYVTDFMALLRRYENLFFIHVEQKS
jgi:hypothetical protein